jgi:uncharacterized protein involved in type VI secretion and phage assembly
MTTLAYGAVELRVGGEAVETDAGHSLVRVMVSQRLSAPTVSEATLTLASESADVDASPGMDMDVRVPGRDVSLFSGQITALTRRHGADGVCEVRLRGYDALHRLRRSQPVRVHTNVTVGRLARELAGPMGIEVAGEDGPTWPHLFQFGQTDLELLVGAAGASGLWITVRGGELHVLDAAGIGERIALALGEDLIEAMIETNVDGACAGVEAHGYDLLTEAPRRGTARTTRAPANQPEGGAEVTLCGLSLGADDLLSAAAQAELDRRASRATTCVGVALGRPDLRPGCRVEITGVGRRSETFVISSATHRFTPDAGYTTEFSTALPRVAPLDAAPVVALGRVTSVEDPDALGRVRVSLAGRGDLESAWLPVLLPGAGYGKGLVALPDPHDDVLVLLAGGVVGQAVVLGGLFGTRGLPDGAPRQGAIDRFAFLTPEGQSVALDDTARSVRLTTGDGSFVELGPERVTVHAACDLLIESPGRSMVLRADTLDFRRG